jgi:transcription elongation factor GreA
MTETYLTAEGKTRLQNELDYLKGPARTQLALRLRTAIQQGDLSENADYIAAKEEQGFLEGRIQELDQVLKNVIIIDDIKQNRGIVGIGAKVTIQEDEFPTETFHLVGPKEADPVNGRISHESPIGSALIGHAIGDAVTVQTPNGSMTFKIIHIE